MNIVPFRVKKTLFMALLLALFFALVIFLHFEIYKQTTYKKSSEFLFNQALQEELEFPLAYGISVYKDGDQLLRLLKLIYRPQNLYCIHVDKKSNSILHAMVKNLTQRYLNIIIPEKFIKVVHSEFSVLESELLCMEALIKHKSVFWKYFINLTGQELPLKTNLEIVRILRTLRSANLIQKTQLNKGRQPTSIGPAPHGLHLWKGSVHVITTRDFVRFALYNRRALDLLEYLKKTIVPDETYFSTLNNEHSLRAPGGYSGNLTYDPILYPFVNRHKIWHTEAVCHGKFLRWICIFSMKDVPAMIANNNTKLFANKFIVGSNDDVSDFIFNWFINRTNTVYAQPKRNPFVNLTYYSQLPVVDNHF